MPSRDTELAQRAVDYFYAVQKPSELEELIRLVRHNVRPGQAIVEIGCDAGGSLFVWRRLAGFVVGIDLRNGRFSSGRRRFDYGAAIIAADSHQPATRAQLVKVLAGRGVGMLFIDGDHTYEGAKKDFEDYAPFVAAGGLIALHDICDHGRPDVDVARVWREVRYRYRATEIIREPKTWGGIGILHVA